MTNYVKVKAHKGNYLWKQLTPQVRKAIKEGYVLAIDPSVGSVRPGYEGGSLPGYATYVAGQLTDRGVITVPPVRSLQARLWEIGRALREDFPAPPGAKVTLILEDVPLKRWSRGGNGHVYGSVKQQASLHKAIGAVLASVRCDYVVVVQPVTWHKVIPGDYVKSDDNDAMSMAEVIYQYIAAMESFKERKVRRGS
jgi:hypothetical protein